MSQTSTPAQSPAVATAGEHVDETADRTADPTVKETVEELPRPTRFADVKGWFWPADQLLFDWFLTHQRDTDPDGRGICSSSARIWARARSSLGGYLRDGEEFTVCDLWDSPAPDDPNSAEMDRSYSTLTRRAFEANYLSFHDELPTLVQAPTSVITSRVGPRQLPLRPRRRLASVRACATATSRRRRSCCSPRASCPSTTSAPSTARASRRRCGARWRRRA